MGGIAGIAGKLDPLTGALNSLLGTEKPAAPATPTVADPNKATAITTAQPLGQAKPTSVGTSARGRTRGSRAASVLTTDLGDSKLGG